MKIHPIRKVRVYEQVIEQIKELVKNGVITPGNKLPSERELATEEDLSFHLSIVEASRNRVIKQMMDLILEPVFEGLVESRKKSLLLPETPEQVVQEHEDILRAILDANAALARDLIIQHLENVIKRSYLTI